MLIIKDSENRNIAIAYIRVSSQRQVDEGVSLDAHKRRIEGSKISVPYAVVTRRLMPFR